VPEAFADVAVRSVARQQVQAEERPEPQAQLPELLVPQEVLPQQGPQELVLRQVLSPELLQEQSSLVLAPRALPQQGPRVPPRERAQQVSEQQERLAQAPPGPQQVSSAQPWQPLLWQPYRQLPQLRPDFLLPPALEYSCEPSQRHRPE
jgi:hypothetical protein